MATVYACGGLDESKILRQNYCMHTKSPRAWQRMLSGRRLNLLDPSQLDIELDDIAHGLARVARWNGQTIGEYPFSVAQHSLLVEAILAANGVHTPHTLAAALLHDAPEYVIGDMISPFKAAMGGDYHVIETRLLHAIHARFGLVAEVPVKLKKAIKMADQTAAYIEAGALAGFSPQECEALFKKPYDVPEHIAAHYLTPWPTDVAKQQFCARFEAVIAALPTTSPR